MPSVIAVFAFVAILVATPGHSAQSTGEMAVVPSISGLINPGGASTAGSGARQAVDPATRAARCGDGFCTAGESEASCPADCPSAIGVCGTGAGTTVLERPVGAAGCAVGNQAYSDGLGDDGTYNWYCQGGMASSPECQALRAIAPACGAANGTVVPAFPVGSAACALGSQFTVDANGDDGQFDWDCRGINTPLTTSCTAPKVAAVMPTVELIGTPTAIALGGSATLTWSVTNANSCTASGDWAGTKSPAGGSQSTGALSVVGAHTYVLTCLNPGGSASDSVTVAVAPLTPAPTVNVTASPSAIAVGQSATLTWTVANATSCTSSGSWTGSKASGGGSQSTGSLGSAGLRAYTLTCSNASGSNSDSATVNVGALPSVNLSASPSSISAGQSSTLTWTASGATSCSASNAWTGAKTASGTNSQSTGVLSTAGARTYRLECANAFGTTADSATVSVVNVPPPSVDLFDSDGDVTSVSGGGETQYLRWTSVGADTCSVTNLTTGWLFRRHRVNPAMASRSGRSSALRARRLIV